MKRKIILLTVACILRTTMCLAQEVSDDIIANATDVYKYTYKKHPKVELLNGSILHLTDPRGLFYATEMIVAVLPPVGGKAELVFKVLQLLERSNRLQN